MRIDRVDTYGNEWVAFVRVRTETAPRAGARSRRTMPTLRPQVLHRQVAPHALGHGRARPRRPSSTLLDARAQVSRLLRLPGAGRRRHGALGPARQARGHERLRAAGRDAAARSTGLCLEHAPRHHARGRGRNGWPGCATRTASTPSSSGSAASAATTRTSGPAAPRRSSPRCARALGRRRALLVDANSCYSPERAIEVGRLLEDAWRRATSRSLARTGSWSGRPRLRRRSTSTSRAASRTAMLAELAADDRAARGRHRAARRLLRRRVHAGPGASPRMAARAGLPCTPHSANLSLVTVFTLHLLARDRRTPAPTSSSRSRARTTTPGRTACSRRPSRSPTARSRRPDGPGWGVEISREWLDGAQHRTTST